MRRVLLAILIVVIIAAVDSQAIAAAARTVPRGAFLRTPVSSVDQLANQCMKDPVVRARFAKHFGVRPEQLGQYLRDNVTIMKVTANTPKNVYIVTRSGRVVSKRTTLKRGAQIFALKDTGEPLLVLACGNPVGKALPPRVKVQSKALPSYEVLRPNEVPPPAKPLAVIPPPGNVAKVSPIVPLAPTRAAPVAAVPPVVAGGKGVSPLLLIPPIIGGIHHGGGGETPPPGVIPEPGGAATVLATGLLPAIGYGVRRMLHGRRRSAAS